MMKSIWEEHHELRHKAIEKMAKYWKHNVFNTTDDLKRAREYTRWICFPYPSLDKDYVGRREGLYSDGC